jgi:hypothetical protein
MSDKKLQFTFGDFKSEPETSGLEDIQFGDFTESLIPIDLSTDKLVVKDDVVEPTKAPAIKVPKKVKAPSRAVQSNDLSNLFKSHGIPKEGNALVLDKSKDCTAISETTYEDIDTLIVEKPVEITQPRTDPTPMKRRSKHKQRGFSLADNLYLEVKDYFHWFVKGLSNPDRVPIVNAFREANIEPLKHPMVFNDKEVLDYFLDCVSGFFRDAKKNHGHRPNFIELNFTYVSANKESNRPKLILHKKGYVLER